MVYQVGRPAMFDGNMFLPEAGTPERSIDRSKTMLAVWLPEPLMVAIWMLKSLTTRCALPAACCSCTARSVGDILKSLRRMKIEGFLAELRPGRQPEKYITRERKPRSRPRAVHSRRIF